LGFRDYDVSGIRVGFLMGFRDYSDSGKEKYKKTLFFAKESTSYREEV
jgi:hypothetical protein